jgi:hypothetical protein
VGHDVSIIVATFGAGWAGMGFERAIPSAMEQGCQVVIEHGPSLADARNHAGWSATGEWLVFLDADDWLDDGYAASILDGVADLRVSPLIEHVDNTTRRIRLSRRHIETLNPCHVGTAIRREMFCDLGGFPVFPAWEDWALFLRAYRLGATIEHLPADRPAYNALARQGSMNRREFDREALHAEIKAWA